MEILQSLKMNKPFKITSRLNSFRFAFAGIWVLLKTQSNAWIHCATTVLAVGCGVWLMLPPVEWCALVLAVMAVWIAEAFNTAVEFLADRVTTEQDPLIKKAKDAAAGAVLIAAIGAVVVGAILFLSRCAGKVELMTSTQHLPTGE